MTAPEAAPGQAAHEPGATAYNLWVDVMITNGVTCDPFDALGNVEQMAWREIGTRLKRPAAQERPAPGEPAGCECGHAQTGHAFSDDVCAVPECPCSGYRRTTVPAPELAAAMRENRILRDSLTEAVEIARIDPPRSAVGQRARKANLDNIVKRCGLPS